MVVNKRRWLWEAEGREGDWARARRCPFHQVMKQQFDVLFLWKKDLYDQGMLQKKKKSSKSLILYRHFEILKIVHKTPLLLL